MEQRFHQKSCMSTTGMNKNKEWNRQVIKKFIYREKGGRKTNSGTGNSSKKLYMKAKEEKKKTKVKLVYSESLTRFTISQI